LFATGAAGGETGRATVSARAVGTVALCGTEAAVPAAGLGGADVLCRARRAGVGACVGAGLWTCELLGVTGLAATVEAAGALDRAGAGVGLEAGGGACATGGVAVGAVSGSGACAAAEVAGAAAFGVWAAEVVCCGSD
jgi:hypothetical protein